MADRAATLLPLASTQWHAHAAPQEAVGVAALAPPHPVGPRHDLALPPLRHETRPGAVAVRCTRITTTKVGGFPPAQEPLAAVANAGTPRSAASVSKSVDAPVLERRSIRAQTQRLRWPSWVPAVDHPSLRAAALRHHCLHRPGRRGTLPATPQSHLAPMRQAPPTGPPAKGVSVNPLPASARELATGSRTAALPATSGQHAATGATTACSGPRLLVRRAARAAVTSRAIALGAVRPEAGGIGRGCGKEEGAR